MFLKVTIFVCFFLNVFLIALSQSLECHDSRECNPQYDVPTCAYCDRLNDAVSGTCHLIDDQVFKEFNPCTYSRSHCDSHFCTRSNQYLEGYGTCLCFCPYSYYGVKCDIKGKETKYPSAFQFLISTHVQFHTPAPYFVTMGDAPRDYSKIYFIIYDEFGDYVARVSEPIIMKTGTIHPKYPYNVCMQAFNKCDYVNQCNNTVAGNYMNACSFTSGRAVFEMYGASLTIPFGWSTPWYKKPTSFIRELNCEVWMGEAYLLTLRHRYHIDAPLPNNPLEYHQVYVQITGCGTTLKSTKKYNYNQEMIFLWSKLLAAGFPDSVHYKKGSLEWKYEAIQLDGDTAKHKIVSDFKIMHRPDRWTVPAFRWLGRYYINASYKAIFQIFSSSREEQDAIYSFYQTSFKLCYVEVEYAPLEAVIAGGSLRFAYSEQEVILDASNSRNPNVPDGEPKRIELMFSCNWTEESVCDPHKVEGSSANIYKIKPNVLKANRSYLFILKVSSDLKNVLPRYTSQTIVVGEMKKVLKNETIIPEIADLMMDCVYNCMAKTNPKDIVYLKISGIGERLSLLNFEWQISQVDPKANYSNNWQNIIDSQRQTDIPSFILILNENALKENTSYNIKAKKKDSPQFAVYSITTSPSVSVSCNITPEKGVAGSTIFNLNCTDTNSIVYCEFYDKDISDESGYSGRMVSHHETCSLDNFILTRGRLEIDSIGEYGTVTYTTIDVQLSKGNKTVDDVNKAYEDNIGQISIASDTELLKRLSFLSDMLIPLHKADVVLEKIVIFLSTIQMDRYEDSKLGISVLHTALLAANGFLSIEATVKVAETLDRLTLSISSALTSGQLCTFQTIYQIYGRVLDCLYLLLTIKERHVLKDSRKFIEPAVYYKLKDISFFVENILNNIETGLSFRQLPVQQHKLIESKVGNLSLWIKVDTSSAISKYTQEQNRTHLFPTFVSNDLASDVKEKGYFLVLYYLNLNINPVFVQKPNTKNILDVTVAFKDGYSQICIYPLSLKHGIMVTFDVSKLIQNIEFKNIEISSKLLHQSRNDANIMELKLPIYKLDPLPFLQVTAQFKFHNNKTEIIVIVARGMRPTFESLIKNGTKVTSTNPVFQVVKNPSNSQQLYYLLVYPDPKVNNSNSTVSFQMKLYSEECYTWHKRWETKGCQPRTDPTTGKLICECKRLSLIGGLVKEVPFSLDAVSYLSPFDLTSSTLEILWYLLPFLILFLLLAIICRKVDRQDKAKRFVSVVPDNMPGDKYGYLVCVVTGARVGAGTDSAVGIQIVGLRNLGRSHILANEKYDVMERFGEDWFIVYEPGHLGKIDYLMLWHDAHGTKPDWFCDYIIIYDLRHRNRYVFLVHDWITLSLKCFPQVMLYPASLSVITSPTRVFMDYYSSGFQLSHLWLNIVVRHPRDPVSRVDRLAIIWCFILTSLVASIILIRIGDNHFEFDDYSFSLTWAMIELSIYTFVPAALVACLLMHLFRRVYKICFYKKLTQSKGDQTFFRRISLHEDYLVLPVNMNDDDNHLHYGQRHKESDRKHKKKPLAEKINLTLIPKPLAPVLLEDDEPNVTVVKKWFLLTWTVVVLIIVFFPIASTFLSQDLPNVKTKKWITISLLTAFIHAFIFLPLKIIINSAFLSVAFKQIIIYKDIFTLDPDVGCRMERQGDILFVNDIVRLRTLSVYKPYQEEVREQHRQRMLRMRRWQNLYQLFLRIFFLVVFGNLLLSHLPELYQANNHLRVLAKDYKEVFNTTDLFDYIGISCDTCLFKYVWYNWKILNNDVELDFFRKDWTCDTINRLIGKVKLAQFRVKPDYCTSSLNISVDCAAPFSNSAEDSRNYFPYWIGGDENYSDSQRKELHIDFQFSNNWTYCGHNDSSNFYEGVSGISYFFGGYIWDLKADSEDFEVSFEHLSNDGWIDHYTRAVLMKYIVYNVNTHFFSEVVLIAERTVTGQILPTIAVKSLDVILNLDLWLAIFIFIAFMMCCRIFCLANFVGLTTVFIKWVYVYELSFALIAVVVVMYILLHQIKVPGYVSDYQKHVEQLNDFHFEKIDTYLYTARSLLSVLYILNNIRLIFSLWRVDVTVHNFFIAFAISLREVICLFLVYMWLQCVALKAVGHILCFPSTSSVLLKFILTAFFVCVFTNCYNKAKLLWCSDETDSRFTLVQKDLKYYFKKSLIETKTSIDMDRKN